MTLFYLVTLPTVTCYSWRKFSPNFANCHLSKLMTLSLAHFALHNAADDVIIGDTRHREVLCITMGLCIIRRYKCEAPINKESVVICHA
jgi:hypothetical protein